MRALLLHLRQLVLLVAVGGALALCVWLIIMIVAAADDSEPEQPPEPMQPLPQVDFTEGPVDLVIYERDRKWLVRDQELVRDAALKQMPDMAARAPFSTFGAQLLSGSSKYSSWSITLQFLRGSSVLSEQACWGQSCKDRPEMRAILDPLLAARQELKGEYVSFPDYTDYLQAYDAAQTSPDRYGDIDPPKPEDQTGLTEEIVISFPVMFAPIDLPVDIPDYQTAFATEYATETENFDLSLNVSETTSLALLRCSDNHIVLQSDGVTGVFPENWRAVGVYGRIKATDDFADRLMARTDRSFLPVTQYDAAGFDEAVKKAVAAAGVNPDPSDCYIVDGAATESRLTLWRNFPHLYGFYWTRIMPKEHP